MIIKTYCCTISNSNDSWEFNNTRHEYTDYKSLNEVNPDGFEDAKDNEIYCLCRDMVIAKAYRSMRKIKKDIAKGKVHVSFRMCFTDTDKASVPSALPYKALETKSRKQVFDEFCTSVSFEWDNYNNSNITRNEVYGLLYDYWDTAIRFELNDYDNYKHTYKFGDIVKLKNPVLECNTAIILCQDVAPNSTIFCKLYDALLLKNGKPYRMLYDYKEGIHQNDIESCIGQDLKTARNYMEKYCFIYKNDVLNEALGYEYNYHEDGE